MKLNLAAGLLPIVLVLALLAPGASAVASVSLGTAAPFAVLAGAGITNTGVTTIVGDVGSHPTGSMTGFDSVVLTGDNHGNDAVTALAKDALMTAYVDARDRPDGTPVGGLGGLTLVPGVYTDNNAPDSMSLTGTLTLDGQNDPNAVFIFQSGSTLLLGANSNVLLVNGAQACNVFWQVTSSATLQTGAHLEGTILALVSITLGTGASIHGAALASTGSVTMASNQVVLDTCDPQGTTSTTTAPPSSTTSSPSQSTTSSPSETTTSSPSQTTTSSPSETTTSSPSETTTSSPSETTTSSPTQSETETTSPSQTTSDSPTSPPPSGTTPPTGTSTSQGPTAEVPFFPSAGVAILASVAALGAALLMIRRRL